MLEKANKDKKHYPADNLEVHQLILVVIIYSSEDCETDISDTDDEDSWEASVMCN